MSSEAVEWITRPATEIGAEIGAGRLDPVALTEAYLFQAEAGDAVYVRLTPERARREAMEARRRAKAGLRRSPLDGVPISWKDLIDLAGVPTEAGSKLRAGARAETDAVVAQRAARAGLVSLGKTHLSELAFSGLGYNPMTATPPNAFDPARVPGGSSSGAAASVALGQAAAAIGSDTGGSVRIPAAWNGLVGLKTTWGLIPNDGVTPLSPSLDTIGPLTRTVADAAALTAVLADRRAPDLTGARLQGAAFLAADGAPLEDMEPDLRAAYDATLERLRAAGARVDAAPVPEFAEALAVAARDGAIVNTEGYAVWGAAIEADPDAMFPMIRERFRSGRGYSAPQIEGARLAFQRLARATLARAAGYDAILTPTTPIQPPLVAEIAEDEQAYISKNLLALRNTRLANLFGLSSLTLPTGRPVDGPPAGLMLFGAPFAEARLLRLGRAMEIAFAEAP